MRRLIILTILLSTITFPVQAMDFSAPEAPNAAQEYMPDHIESFGDGLRYVIKSAISSLSPSIKEASSVCLSLIGVSLIAAMLNGFKSNTKRMVDLVCTVMIGLLLVQPAKAFITLGTKTIEEMSEYGKLLLPVMTAAMAAQGLTTTSTALYSGTVLFNTLLVNAVSEFIVPMIYIYLCLSIVNSAIENDFIRKIRKFIKWMMTWGLKIVLYVFIGYITVTGVVSGTTDTSVLKAAKIAISGAVPVVGGILSDASEAVLVSAGVMKNTAGVYGILTMIAVYIGPFFKIGAQYIILKVTSAICGVFETKENAALISDFSEGMGMILAMTGTVCLLHLISTVCFLKGVA